MKKVFVSTLVFLLIFTNVSFANTISLKDSIKDIEMVSNRMYIIIKQITGDDTLDVYELNRDIKFCESILSTRAKKISDAYSNKSSIEVGRIYSALLYTISLYQLSLTSITMYIRDDSKANHFIEACSSYQQGNSSLENIKLKNLETQNRQEESKKEKSTCH
ncbi:hypothetical protein [Romboutsia lituseburensis]|uniref:hypothetical protein n=1 Tax=Romboutsia lituseburensis TaxID=1537 RepID=UPI00215AE1D7|nr:hypothetical protein [Romboutsia lituseburensis]MCR8747107.1 hypothetical protein [Romboutsia lituseburensis]